MTSCAVMAESQRKIEFLRDKVATDRGEWVEQSGLWGEGRAVYLWGEGWVEVVW